MLNHAKGMPCYAFIITPEGIAAHLLDVTSEDAADAERRLTRAVKLIYARGGKRPALAELLAVRDDFTKTLAWTWHKVVRPVLEPLGYLKLHPRREPDRGAYGGCRPGRSIDCRCRPPSAPRPDVVRSTAKRTSAAAPWTAWSHRSSRASRRWPTLGHGSPGARALSSGGASIVAESERDELPGAEAAARFAAAALGNSDLRIGPEATRASVLSALGILRGCNSAATRKAPPTGRPRLDPAPERGDPDGAGHLPGPAGVGQARRAHGMPGTARTSERLPDEAVHIASAFLLAGYPEAVGTLWEVESTQIERFLRGFYSRTLDGTHGAAHAVHHTARELRHKFPNRPHVWAAYVHAGG